MENIRSNRICRLAQSFGVPGGLIRQALFSLLAAALVVAIVPAAAIAQERPEVQVKEVENRVSQLEAAMNHYAPGAGGIAFLYGVFCALWAQNTGRSPWLWFFMGLLFTVITAIVLLVKNANDRKRQRCEEPVPDQVG